MSHEGTRNLSWEEMTLGDARTRLRGRTLFCRLSKQPQTLSDAFRHQLSALLEIS